MPNSLENIMYFTVPEERARERLDTFLASQLPSVTRAKLKRLVDGGHVTIDEKPVTKAGHSLRAGDDIRIEFPPPKASHLEPEDIPLDIVFEDDDLLVVNKPPGMVVHPAYGNMSGTLVNALLGHAEQLSEVGGAKRPGLVHRLDKDTSGLLVVAKNDVTHVGLARQLSDHKMAREYRAIVCGHPKQQGGTIEAALGRHQKDRTKMRLDPSGKHAITHYTVLEELPLTSFVRLNLETGRTHQIRVHMASINHPVFGDSVYGGSGKWASGLTEDRQRFLHRLFKKYNRQMLHALSLAFNHPATGEWMQFESPLPDDMQKLLHILRTASV